MTVIQLLLKDLQSNYHNSIKKVKPIFMNKKSKYLYLLKSNIFIHT